MVISNRLSKIEQTVDDRMRALMLPDDVLIERRVIVRRVLDYLGLPNDGDGLDGYRQTHTRIAQIMLSTGCERRVAIVKQCAETHGVTDERAEEWLQRLGKVGRDVQSDINSGKPFCESEAGARMRVILARGPKAGLDA
jgi:hypothetical protein